MQEQLTILIESLREAPVHLDLEIPPETLDLVDEEYKFTEAVRANVVFRLIGETDVMALGTLLTRAETVCVRCLEAARIELSAKVSETWLKGPAPDDVANGEIDNIPLTRAFDGETIDVVEVLRELIMDELPLNPVCSAECKGLCAGCGVNLNSESCKCAVEEKEAEDLPIEPEWKKSLKKIHLDK